MNKIAIRFLGLGEKRTRPLHKSGEFISKLNIEKFHDGMGGRVEFKCFVMQCFKDGEQGEWRIEVSCDKYWFFWY